MLALILITFSFYFYFFKPEKVNFLFYSTHHRKNNFKNSEFYTNCHNFFECNDKEQLDLIKLLLQLKKIVLVSAIVLQKYLGT